MMKLLLLALALIALPGSGDAPGVAVKVRERRVPEEKGVAIRINRPFFDANGRLAFNASPVPGPGQSFCAEGTTFSRRVTHLLSPRVDEVECTAAGGRRAMLLGIDGAGRTVWRRPLGFRSGEFNFDEIVAGASREGIVLNNLTVLSPATGEVLFHPPTHPVGAEKRPVPDHDLAEATAYLPDRRAFATFQAEVSLFERSGGVDLLDPGTGRREPLLPVVTTLLGGYWRVEAMALDSSRRYLLLGNRFSFRGPGGVSLVVFDLAARRKVYEERFIEDHYGGELAFCVDAGGNVGFSFLDETEARRVLVHYRIAGRPA